MSTSYRKALFVDNLRREQMLEQYSQGRRSDGRGLNDYRDLKIQVGTMIKANGSATVDLGYTRVVAGVKVAVGTPFPDTPDEGILVVGAEVLPIASAYAEPGPPDEDSIELARVVDRGVRESHMVDMHQMVIEEGKKVYSIFVDVAIVNVDGNLLDATSYAVVAALANAKFKKMTLKEDQVVELEEVSALPILRIPVSVTTSKLGDFLLSDPTTEEEAIQEARITFAIADGQACAAQKGGQGSFSPEQVLRALDLSMARSKEIEARIREAVGFAKEGSSA
ncbi:MAG TPA: exosome complex protein Rrp42 [Conexivisphaerales archaeon]|nr:exosome complex protein Rrp42 [Conexivisphaerales archaeon]